jgi:hypothetical protein
MADTKKDDPDAPSIARDEESHEMRALSVEAQIAREHLPVTPRPDPGESEGERRDFARASCSLQTKGPRDDGGTTTPHWSDLANVVAPRDPAEEDHEGSHAPITHGGLPSFAQSEFSTVCFSFMFSPRSLLSFIEPSHIDCPSSTP